MSFKVRITEKLPDNRYVAVDEHGASYTAILKGNLKKNAIYVGDFALAEKSYDSYVITKILERTNCFVRPPVANIDYMVLCLSINSPKPDLNLLDKQIVLTKSKSAEPIILITKMDLIDEKSKEMYNYIMDTYTKIGIKVISISAQKESNILEKLGFEEGKVYAFSGSSGVGKSTIISKLLNDSTIEVSDVAVKTNRGRHTTKYVKLYNVGNAFVVDTPGFSSYELLGIEAKSLKDYYPEFIKIKCIYSDCMHAEEKECNVKEKVSIRSN
ncbi:MAG: ribosome small subunit-dependent GTPase A [Clostridia bacterium]|nr:ribosome small subunit-dependent GTPase A [Clostridia bacterium]